MTTLMTRRRGGALLALGVGQRLGASDARAQSDAHRERSVSRLCSSKRKVDMRTILLASTTAAVLTLGASAAFADPAVVIRQELCVLLDGDGNVVATTDIQQVVATQSANGNVNAQCDADVAPPSSGRAARFDFASTGLLCVFDTPFGVETTDDWKVTVSASGQAKIVCHLK
jgi:hypothetical protein